jgi:hypothetical protein
VYILSYHIFTTSLVSVTWHWTAHIDEHIPVKPRCRTSSSEPLNVSRGNSCLLSYLSDSVRCSQKQASRIYCPVVPEMQGLYYLHWAHSSFLAEALRVCMLYSGRREVYVIAMSLCIFQLCPLPDTDLKQLTEFNYLRTLQLVLFTFIKAALPIWRRISEMETTLIPFNE